MKASLLSNQRYHFLGGFMGPHRDKPNSGPNSFSDDDDPQYVMKMMMVDDNDCLIYYNYYYNYPLPLSSSLQVSSILLK